MNLIYEKYKNALSILRLYLINIMIEKRRDKVNGVRFVQPGL